MTMMKRWILIGCAAAAAACAELTTTESPQEVLRETLKAVQKGGRAAQADRLKSRISSVLSAAFRPGDEEVAVLSAAADCTRYLELTGPVLLRPETEQWFLGNPGRLHLLVNSVLPSDNLKRCFQGLEKLMAHDPAGRDDWLKLMLALSAVWDTPRRPPVHYQIGEAQLPYKPDLTARYDWFRRLYESGAAKIPYDALTVRDLLFVVATPVPLSELQWALDNERGELSEWGNKFHDIVYDTSRLNSGGYVWPYESYTLAAIREKGGICVDQTYYAVVTARAFGIPAFYIHAVGKSSAHAWFSYMTEPGRWALDVGRYESEEYTTGWAMNPQTNEQISDHELTLISERAEDPQRMRESDVWMAVALSITNDPVNSRAAAELARRADPLNRAAWEFEIDALIAEKDDRGLLRLFEDLEDAFASHPDVIVEAAQKISPVLEASGRADEAGRLQRHLARKVDDERDDLARFMGIDEIEALVEEGDVKRARRKMEDVLEEHLEDGNKAVPLIRFYLEMTGNTDQGDDAADFLEEYIGELFDTFAFDIARRELLLKLLLQAYEQAGDDDGVAEISSRLKNF